MKSNRIAFTVLLPLLSLALPVALVDVPVTFNYLQLRHDPRGAPNGIADPAKPHSLGQIIAVAMMFEPENCADLINGIDMPANFITLPLDRFLPAWPDDWTPEGVSVFSWRALTFPIYSLPFWWFAGLGLDALFKRRRKPHWGTLLSGTVLCAIFLGLSLLFSFMGRSPHDDPAVSVPILIGAILWTILFAAFPIAWIRARHRRLTRQLE